MTGNSKDPWGLPAEGLPPTPSEGRAQYYNRHGPAASQRTRVYDNGTALTFGPQDPIAEPTRGGAFDSQFLQINAAIKDLQMHNLQSGSHNGSSNASNRPYDNFRMELMDPTTLPYVTYPSGRYISVASKYAGVEVVTHLWSIPNKSDTPGIEHNKGTADTRFGVENKPTLQAPPSARQTIKGFGGKQRLNKGGPSGTLNHRLGQINGPSHSFQPRNASVTSYTMQDTGSLQYKHPLHQQGLSYKVPIHAGQQRADQMHAEKLRAERLRREEEDRRYAHRMQYEEMLIQETHAERARKENNYGQVHYSKGTFNTPAVAGFPPSFDGASEYPQSHGMAHSGDYHVGDSQFSAEESNTNMLARAQTSAPGKGRTTNKLDQGRPSRGRIIERDPGYTKPNRKAKVRGNAEWARELDRMNQESRLEGDLIGVGDIASGEALVQMRMGIHFTPIPMSPQRMERRARTPDHPPPQLTVTQASPLSQDPPGHGDGRSSAPILGSGLTTAPRNLNVLQSWGQLTGRSATTGSENRIFGELPGTVRDFSPTGQLGRRFYEQK